MYSRSRWVQRMSTLRDTSSKFATENRPLALKRKRIVFQVLEFWVNWLLDLGRVVFERAELVFCCMLELFLFV